MERSDDTVIKYEKHLPDLIDSTGRYENRFNLWQGHPFEDSQGRLWMTNAREICYYDKKKSRFIRLIDNPSSEDKLPPGRKIQVWHETASGMLWATGRAGVYKILPPFTKIDENAIMASEVIHCKAINSAGTIIDTPQSITSYMDSTGNIWLGTENSGLVRLTKQEKPEMKGYEFEKKVFTADHGLPSNKVVSIIDDGRGNLWLGTVNGLSKFNLQSETFTNYYARHGLSQ